MQRDLSTYIKNIDDCDWKQEIAFKIMKLSNLRDIQRSCFLRALFAAGFSYVVVIGLQILNPLSLG